MVLVVKCLICHKELPYSKSDPSQLIDHVKTEHPTSHQRSRKSVVKNPERKFKAQNELEILKRNSASLRSLVDKEIQTDFVWSHFMKMNKNEDKAGSSQAVARSSKDMTSSPKNSSRSSNDCKEDLKVTLINVPPKKPLRSFSPPTSHEENLNVERFKNKPSPNKPPRTFAHRTDGDYSPCTSKDFICPMEKISDQKREIKMKVDKDAKVLYNAKREATVSPNRKKDYSKKTERKHRKFYKTSIEKWRPIGDEKIHCPRCQSHKRPIVRTETERTTESSFASTLVMTCWPLCFSPCLFPEPTHENLHCPVCNLHFGVYDHKKGIVLPDREFLKQQQ